MMYFNVNGKRALLCERFHRLDVCEDLALHVGRAARVDVIVADSRFKKRRRDPFIKGVRGLHIVVTVHQHRLVRRRGLLVSP